MRIRFNTLETKLKVFKIIFIVIRFFLVTLFVLRLKLKIRKTFTERRLSTVYANERVLFPWQLRKILSFRTMDCARDDSLHFV